MPKIAYDPKRCSLYHPANLKKLDVNERADKQFFSTCILNRINTISNSDTETGEAALCAELSRLVYLKFEPSPEGPGLAMELENYLKNANLRLVKWFNNDGTQAFLAESSDNRLFLVFRGTESADFRKITPKFMGFIRHKRTSKSAHIIEALKDLWADLRFKMVPFKIDTIKAGSNPINGKVHAGFLGALSVVWNEVFNTIKVRLNQGGDLQIVIIGHSLGAALTVLAGAALESSGIDKDRLRLHTFGCPLVGNKSFVLNALQGVNHRRHVDCRDIVTRVPPCGVGYEHTGSLYYIDRFGEILQTPDSKSIFVDRLIAFMCYIVCYKPLPFLNDNVLLRDLADHAPINYVSALTGLR